MSYRDTLYASYSSNFGTLKQFDHGKAVFPAFDANYANLPGNKNMRILDTGCGKGEWLAWLKNKGYRRLFGVDGAEEDLEIARTWLPDVHFETGLIQSYLDSYNEEFDLIHAKDVIEHFTKEELIAFLKSVMNRLSPGGEIWLQTFNAQAPLASATRYGDFTHEIGLTPTSLAQCLRATGYELKFIKGVHYCSSSLSGRIRRVLGFAIEKTARLILQARHGGSWTQSDSVDRLCSLPDMLAVASKPL